MSNPSSVKAAFSYYGGKQSIAPQIANIIRDMPHTIYAEPFAGGCAVLFNKPFDPTSRPRCFEILNDTNELIVNWYRVLQSNYEELLYKIKYTPFSEAEYQRAKRIYREKEKHDQVTLAWAFTVGIMQSFNKALFNGWASSKQVDDPIAWENYKYKLEIIYERLKYVAIANRDALKFIKVYDSEQSLFYCDPPYPGTQQQHYKGYTQEDFEELIEVLAGIKGSFVLSCYSNHAIPKDWECVTIKTKARSYGKSSRETYDPKKSDRCEFIWYKSSGMKELPLLKCLSQYQSRNN